MNTIIVALATVFFLVFSSLGRADVIIVDDTQTSNPDPQSSVYDTTVSQSEGVPRSQVAKGDFDLHIENPYIQLGAGETTNAHGVTNTRFKITKISAGIDISRRFAVELGNVSFAEIMRDDKSANYLSLVVKYPFSKRITLSGKLGISSWHATQYVFFGQDVETSGTSQMLGAELKYDVLKNISLTLELDYFGGLNEIPASAGLRVSF